MFPKIEKPQCMIFMQCTSRLHFTQLLLYFLFLCSGYKPHDCLFDDEEFRSELYQRPYQRLRDYDRQGQQPMAQGDAAAEKQLCLETLLK
jgi:hypothetical protein